MNMTFLIMFNPIMFSKKRRKKKQLGVHLN